MLGKIAPISLSGLIAAEKRVETPARNVANFRTVGARALAPSPSQELLGQKAYQPQRTDLSSRAGGGVVAVNRPVSPASFPVFDPTNSAAGPQGFVDGPNVSLGLEMAEIKIAVNAYRANLKVMETVNRMERDLIDVISGEGSDDE
ncbi:MAG: flagellar basal body rod C-terminal domain-containing protein [Sphingomonadales bacterium]